MRCSPGCVGRWGCDMQGDDEHGGAVWPVVGTPLELRQLGAQDLALMDGLLAMFGAAFNDLPTYTGRRASDDYLRKLLAGDSFIALAAIKGDSVVGGIAAYELHKFEQQRSEIYLYDLAVLATHRRQGIATALIHRLKAVAAARGAWVVFVQADTGPEDRPAIALYDKLGTREEVLHFDIPVDGAPRPLRRDA
jgi:aminoglycoside 3-N-acetyltransferase I